VRSLVVLAALVAAAAALVGIAAHAKWGYQSGRLPSVVDARRYAQKLLLLCGDVFAAFY
jgi:hypothetical protein